MPTHCDVQTRIDCTAYESGRRATSDGFGDSWAHARDEAVDSTRPAI